MSYFEYVLSLGLIVILTACHSTPCNNTYQDFKYLDKVKIQDDFYKGQIGVIINKTWLYTNVNQCTVPAFDIKLDSTGETIKIDQNKLTLIKKAN